MFTFINIYSVQCSLLHFKQNICSPPKFTRDPFVKIQWLISIIFRKYSTLNSVHFWTESKCLKTDPCFNLLIFFNQNDTNGSVWHILLSVSWNVSPDSICREKKNKSGGSSIANVVLFSTMDWKTFLAHKRTLLLCTYCILCTKRLYVLHLPPL